MGAGGAGTTTRRQVRAWVCLALIAGCHRDDSAPSGGEPKPLPAPSVITVGVQLRGCDADAEACERECEAGDADRCRALAVSLAQGPADRRDEPKATALYAHA